ncbi:MAG: divalent-cation tolerance protein CutA [bacterium]|nr:divalent-cation tolerance protein CutA [bacterium]
MEYIQITTTFDKEKDARKIMSLLVEKSLAPCVQITGPVTSVYRWQEKVEVAKEWRCEIKTKKSFYNAVEKLIKDNHPYEVPEIIAVPIIYGSNDYLNWIDSELKQ